jgi:osmotically-inducible protein OsmY
MADNGWRDEDRRRWDQGTNRFEGDPRRRWRSGGRDDDRFMEGRNGGSWARSARDDWRGRPNDLGREGDYSSRYATPLESERDLRNRPGGMRDDDWEGDYNSRFGGGTFERGFSSGERTGYYGGVSSYGRTALGGDDYLDGRDFAGYGDEDRSYNPRASGDHYGPNTSRQSYHDPREYDRSWWNKAGDEMASWVGDEDAARRRDMDRMRSHAGRGPKGYVRSDDRIREDVNDRLTEDWRLDATNIDASVSNGEVTLSGTVDGRDDKHRAEHLIENLSGVKHVQNNLRVDESWREAGAWNQRLSTPVGSSGVGTSLLGAQTTTGTSTGSGIGGNAGQRATGENTNSTH